MTDCDVTYNSIERDCAGSVGGIKSLRIIDRNSITAFTQQTCVITDMTLADGSAFVKYGIARESSSFTSTDSYDLTTGVHSVQTDVVAVLAKMTGEKNCELKKFVSGTAVALIQDNNNKWWLIGVDDEFDEYALTLGDGSNATTGTARTDLNGYNLTLSHFTNHYPYEVSQDVIDSLNLNGGGAAPASAKVSTASAKKATAKVEA